MQLDHLLLRSLRKVLSDQIGAGIVTKASKNQFVFHRPDRRDKRKQIWQRLISAPRPRIVVDRLEVQLDNHFKPRVQPCTCFGAAWVCTCGSFPPSDKSKHTSAQCSYYTIPDTDRLLVARIFIPSGFIQECITALVDWVKMTSCMNSSELLCHSLVVFVACLLAHESEFGCQWRLAQLFLFLIS